MMRDVKPKKRADLGKQKKTECKLSSRAFLSIELPASGPKIIDFSWATSDAISFTNDSKHFRGFLRSLSSIIVHENVWQADNLGCAACRD